MSGIISAGGGGAGTLGDAIDVSEFEGVTTGSYLRGKSDGTLEERTTAQVRGDLGSGMVDGEILQAASGALVNRSLSEAGIQAANATLAALAALGTGSNGRLTNTGGVLSWEPAGGGAWGGITGTLADQTDLQSALDAKLALAGGTMTGALKTTAGALGATTENYLSGDGSGHLWLNAASGKNLYLTHANSAGAYVNADGLNIVQLGALGGAGANWAGSSAGNTWLNAPTGQIIYLSIQGAGVVGVGGSSVYITPPTRIGATGTPGKKLEVIDAAAEQLRLAYTAGSVYTDFYAISTGGLQILPSGGQIELGRIPRTTATVGGSAYSEAFGNSATLSGAGYETAFGAVANASGYLGSAFGAYSEGAAGGTGLGCYAIGAANGVAVGYDAQSLGSGGIAFGVSSRGAANTLVAGSGSYPVNQIHAGKGITAATPTAWALRGTGGSGTDIAGAGLNLDGGAGTGNAAGGSVKLRATQAGTSGTTLQTTYLDRIEINPTGVGFYGATPVAQAAHTAAATDAATTQTLANALRTMAINLGLMAAS